MNGLSRRTLLAATVATMLAAGATAHAQETIKIGVLATLQGAFTVLGQDSMRGADLAF